MNEHEPSPKKISRRELLIIIASASLVAGATIARSCFSGENREELSNNQEKPETNRLPKLPPENLQPFVPSIEIAEQIDSETFKAVAEELFTFSNKVDAGKVDAIGKIPQTHSLAWERLIPFQKEGQGQNLLHLRWGYRMTEQLGTFVPDSTAREIAIGRFNFGLGIPFTSLKGALINPKDFIDNLENSKVVNFGEEEPPRLFWPTAKDTQNDSSVTVIKPIELSPDQLAIFLQEAIDYFNSRISIKKGIPRIDPSRII